MKRFVVSYESVFHADDEKHAVEQFLDEIGIDVAILPNDTIKHVSWTVLVEEIEEGED